MSFQVKAGDGALFVRSGPSPQSKPVDVINERDVVDQLAGSPILSEVDTISVVGGPKVWMKIEKADNTTGSLLEGWVVANTGFGNSTGMEPPTWSIPLAAMFMPSP